MRWRRTELDLENRILCGKVPGRGFANYRRKESTFFCGRDEGF
jgi:hypothetical protein